jgi:hypothetical protein
LVDEADGRQDSVRDDPARRALICRVSAFVILPTLLVILESVSVRTQLKFVLFPPLAAIGFRMFREPAGKAANWRSAVAAPVLASVAGLVLSQAGGLSAWTTATATLTAMLLIEVLDADAPPALAVVLLALFAQPYVGVSCLGGRRDRQPVRDLRDLARVDESAGCELMRNRAASHLHDRPCSCCNQPCGAACR